MKFHYLKSFMIFDTLNSVSKGYASYDYDVIDYIESKMIKLDIHVNKKKVDALSQILHKDNSYRRSRELIENLKNLYPGKILRLQFKVV